ncbi:hypothetical protein [Alteribacillus sp. YIM 98480]|uniref:hypothetical protein n=1 Tax=Alteribacillus sp. YIM 98480 TaxID=2606599 RepID=UPI00131C64DC|nr:hypothetical protein [Alteribacillus sp. YIM 98480]
MDHYILIAAVDYEFDGGTSDFRVLCDNRMKRIIAQNKAKKAMMFHIYDFLRGEIATHEITYHKGIKKQNKTVQNKFARISKANYTSNHGSYRFKDGQDNVMSILDVYQKVQNIGKNSPHSLIELSFFSHGWMGGPILVNSYDDREANIQLHPSLPSFTHSYRGSSLRDPDDKDPRGNLDFNSPTMTNQDLKNFQNAFHNKGYIWIWGCAFPRSIHQILHKMEKHPSYRENGLGDDTLFVFTNFTKEEVKLLENYLQGHLPPFPDKQKIAIEFKYIKFFFCLANQNSYSYQIAKHANVKTYAALLGTYSIYEKGRLPLLKIEGAFKRHFKFYKNYLGFDFDPEGRNYGEYLPGMSCSV